MAARKTPRSRDTQAEAEASAPGTSLDKALLALECIANAPNAPTVGELATLAGLSRPTTYRLVRLLMDRGYVSQNPVDARLSVGYSVLPLAASALDRNRLRVEAMPLLQQLADQTGERVNMGILYRQAVLVLGGIEKPSLPTIRSRFGRIAPAHSSGLGKAMLSRLPEAQVRAIVKAHPMIAKTPNTITAIAPLLKDLAEARERGYAIDRGENSVNVFCIAAPVFGADDQPLAAVSISGRTIDSLFVHAPALLNTTELIAHLL